MIRKISWWILFLFYGIPLLVNVPWSFISISRILMTDSNIWQEAMAFPYPLPEFLAKMMPSRLSTMLVALFLLNLLLAVFPAHRVWLMLSGREKGVPAAYNGLAQWLGMAGAFFIAAFVLGIIVTMVLRAGSGVPAAMLLIPTPYLVPTSFVLTEIKSFMQHRAGKRRKARAMRPER